MDLETTLLWGCASLIPSDLSIKFETLRRRCSTHYLDFLCLLALHMDANRNYRTYVSNDSRKVDEFLGTTSWRTNWAVEERKGTAFPKFLAAEFAKQMETLGEHLHRLSTA